MRKLSYCRRPRPAQVMAGLVGISMLCWLAWLGSAFAQSAPTPDRAQNHVFNSFVATGRAPDISVTSSSSDEALGTSGPVALVYNLGSNYAYVGLASAASSVTASTGIPVPPGACASLGAEGMTHIQAITGSGTTTLQVSVGYGTIGPCGGNGVVSGTITTSPSKNSGAYAPVLVGTSSGPMVSASAVSVFLDIVNESATATIACAFGTAAVINGAGSITLPPLWHRSWEGSFVPTDAVNCIASAASTPATVAVK